MEATSELEGSGETKAMIQPKGYIQTKVKLTDLQAEGFSEAEAWEALYLLEDAGYTKTSTRCDCGATVTFRKFLSLSHYQGGGLYESYKCVKCNKRWSYSAS